MEYDPLSSLAYNKRVGTSWISAAKPIIVFTTPSLEKYRSRSDTDGTPVKVCAGSGECPSCCLRLTVVDTTTTEAGSFPGVSKLEPSFLGVPSSGTTVAWSAKVPGPSYLNLGV